ncbi:Alkyl hydroperoxide reductase and/or thiol-specific antioxidant family (AhpC/TSA) protein [Paramagnetospirillum magnetotacticum MS-1]|uniref:Alkyl hydroperoxide reductase and/or thiol-specific antioxidant family (AhpC/TSA) protein n=1 Tax=Paramagnetospirillum magnetotacticum MS-1 TaxID=272627 RepID=A0A0C2V461_PARME|nr:thioredoxin family protein [Paramagnetospirillum magnetotacticum]KIL99866.1 Alkyl hydroperoxide reductase and/or thiol-specific antioxidant family (AhpC/TSA) protein [Paramagnetospirillum magnetotacticum MS-1]
MAVTTPVCAEDWAAPDFALPGIDGRIWNLGDIRGERGTLVAFICNHCPYVVAIIDRLARDAQVLQDEGFGVVGINANDPLQYPEDSFDNMKVFAGTHGLGFPYLFDESQSVARAYGAVCTPDFFGLDRGDHLRYRGRLDESGRLPAAPDARRELLDAMRMVARTGRGPAHQVASMGCSIKWRDP